LAKSLDLLLLQKAPGPTRRSSGGRAQKIVRAGDPDDEHNQIPKHDLQVQRIERSQVSSVNDLCTRWARERQQVNAWRARKTPPLFPRGIIIGGKRFFPRLQIIRWEIEVIRVARAKRAARVSNSEFGGAGAEVPAALGPEEKARESSASAARRPAQIALKSPCRLQQHLSRMIPSSLITAAAQWST
jgi:hypothetical protein